MAGCGAGLIAGRREAWKATFVGGKVRKGGESRRPAGASRMKKGEVSRVESVRLGMRSDSCPHHERNG